MFSANLLVLMVWLLPQILLGQLGVPANSDGHPPPSLNPGLVQSIQDLLLNRLGLRSLPAPRPGAPIPQYLLDLYRFHAQQYHLVQDPWFSFPVQHVQKANTVRGFHHLESLDPMLPPLGTTMLADGVRITFNVSSIPPDEFVTSAELRLLHGVGGGSSDARRVSLYFSEDQGHMGTTLLESRVLHQGDGAGPDSWESFVLNADLFKRAAGRSGHLEFVLEVTNPNRSAGERLRMRRSTGQNEQSWARERPLLVTYSHDGRGQTLMVGRGRGRRGSKSRDTKLAQRGRRDRRVKRNGGRAAKLKRLSQARCRRHPLYVDFNDVGWNKWIVAPSGYHAFFCLGECRFPLADHMNSSSHAMVQTLVNSVNGAVPRPCCVPTSLSPIAMLYLDQQDRVVLKNYQDMVVEGCGCR